jgi:hypothetical protein
MNVIDLSKQPGYKPRASRELRGEECERIARGMFPPDGVPTEFHHAGGFWPLNVTLEDKRCGHDPRNYRGPGAYRAHQWD